MKIDRPIPDSYWVIPGRLLAGEYPGAKDTVAAREKVRRMLEAGVTFFLDLTEADEYGLRPYTSLVSEEAAALGRQAVHQRRPIADLTAPSRAWMREILRTINEALAAGHVLYVHCWGGIGRTGTVIGCFLVSQGLSGDEALSRIAELRDGLPDGRQLSPETAPQRQLVRGWSEGGAER
jgi:predicted protein tyrosine phosphatase